MKVPSSAALTRFVPIWAMGQFCLAGKSPAACGDKAPGTRQI